MREINIESGHPDVLTAMNRLKNGLYASRASGVRAVKIIHGYGSTGKGGAIKMAALKELRMLKTQRMIIDFCAGEKFGPFSEDGRRLVARDPSLKADKDFARSNDGITIVVFK